MKDCFKRSFLPFFALVFFGSTIFIGCTNVDNLLGMGLLPDDQEMVFTEAMVGGIKSYMAYQESLPVDQLNMMALGNYAHGYGLVRTGAMIQFVPGSFGNNSKYYGYKPQIDSIYLQLQISQIFRNSENDEQVFHIYRMKKNLENGEKIFYYPVPLDQSFDASEYADMSQPLFKFTLKDERTGSVTKRLEYDPGSAGDLFVQELIAADTALYSWVDDDQEHPYLRFREEFNGFYITPDPGQNLPGNQTALYIVSPLVTYDSSYGTLTYDTYLGLAGRNFYTAEEYAELDDDEKEDLEEEVLDDGKTYYVKENFTTYPVKYSFADNYLGQNSDGVSVNNTNVMVLERSYTSYPSVVDESKIIFDPEDFVSGSLPSEETIYIQGLLGVAGYLDFDGEFLSNLKALAQFDGQERILNVNRARLYIWLDDTGGLLEERDPETGNFVTLDNAPTRLGMYYNYEGYDDYKKDQDGNDQEDQTVTYGKRKPRGIPDYNYIYEQTYSSPLNYSGYLNRATGGYEMDITLYIRDLLKEEDTQKQIWLAPGATPEVMFVPSQVAIQNPAWSGIGDPPKKRMELKLTYTLLKKTIDD